MINGRVCILGAGNMGRALIGGLLRAGTRPEQVNVLEPDAATRARLAHELGITATADPAVALAEAAVVVLAVKPQDARTLLTTLGPSLLASRALLISVAAAVTLAALERWCPKVPAVRAMPNRPALLGAGATGAYASAAVGVPLRRLAESVLGATGIVVWVHEEAALDVVTALSGSGPAYFFLLAELMSEAAGELGLDATSARRLAVATLYGSGLMAQAADTDLEALRQAVTSPGGTTDAALSAFAAADLKGAVRAALGAAVARSHELAASATA
jgi:pyrroline-5-carboxylate reductase